MNLDEMSREELQDLQRQVNAALKNYDDRRKKDAHSRLDAMARELGFSLADFNAMKKGKSSGGVPRYVHPENPSKTWSGRGRQPQWFKDAIGSGKTEADMAL